MKELQGFRESPSVVIQCAEGHCVDGGFQSRRLQHGITPLIFT